MTDKQSWTETYSHMSYARPGPKPRLLWGTWLPFPRPNRLRSQCGGHEKIGGYGASDPEITRHGWLYDTASGCFDGPTCHFLGGRSGMSLHL